eukprot:PhM_4_TR18050/c1_g1_i1/m.43955/K03165/TOP3; DNA topoisomerase III
MSKSPDKGFVLVLVERPATALALAELLSPGGDYSKRKQGESAVYNFTEYFQPLEASIPFRVTAASGNIFSLDVSSNAAADEDIFSATAKKKVARARVANHVSTEAKGASAVIFAFDNDRKSEAKCYDLLSEGCIADVPDHLLFRAVFEALTTDALFRAFSNLQPLRRKLALAWEAAQSVNARVGSSFMRLMTRVFQGRYGNLDTDAVTYGSAIIPTLALCASTAAAMKKTADDDPTVVLIDDETQARWTWQPQPGKSKNAADALSVAQAALQREKSAKVVGIHTKTHDIASGRALTMPSLMVIASHKLNFSPSHTLALAENLYLAGLITYPRTLCGYYPSEYNYDTIFDALAKDPALALSVQKRRRAMHPTKPGVSDAVPILPVGAASVGDDTTSLSGDQLELFKLIVRHFLAGDCSYKCTKMSIECGGEIFAVNGIKIVDAGLADLYPKTDYMPELVQGHVPVEKLPAVGAGATLRIKRAMLQQQVGSKKSSKTGHHLGELTEAALIQKMEAHALGSDGSMAPYLGTLYERKFVEKSTAGTMVTTNLGMALFRGFAEIDPLLVDPKLRKQFERAMSDIEKGLATMDAVVDYFIGIYKNLFQKVKTNLRPLVFHLDRAFNPSVAAELAQRDVLGEYQLLWRSAHCGPHYASLCSKIPAWKRVFPMYNRETCELVVYGPLELKSAVAEEWTAIHAARTREFEDTVASVPLLLDTAEVKLGAGLTLRSARTFSRDLIVSVRVVFNSDEMRLSFFRDKRLEPGSNVDWWSYNRSKQLLVLGFYDILGPMRLAENMAFDTTASIINNGIGRTVVAHSEETAEELQGELEEADLSPIEQRTFIESELVIDNLPTTVKPAGIARFLRDCGIERYEFSMTRGANGVKVTVRPFGPLKGVLPTMKRIARSKMPVNVVVSAPRGRRVHHFSFLLTGDAVTAAALLNAHVGVKNAAVTHDVLVQTGGADVAEIFPDDFLDTLTQSVIDSYGVSCTVLHSVRGVSIRLSGHSVKHAYEFVRDQIECTRIDAHDPALSELFSMYDNGALPVLEAKVKESKGMLKIAQDGGDGVVFGPPIARGGVVAEVSEVYQDLLSRVEEVAVASVAHYLFLPDGPGEAKLAHMDKALGTARFIVEKKVIRFVATSAATLPSLKSQIEEYLGSVSGGAQQAKCWCGRPCGGDRRFGLCGHVFCRPCIEELVKKGEYPLKCPCSHEAAAPTFTPLISFDDLRNEFSTAALEDIATKAFRAQLPSSSRDKYQISLCISEECDGIVANYCWTECTACGTKQCLRCKTTDAIHEGQSCHEFSIKKLELKDAELRRQAILKRAERLRNLDANYQDILDELVERGKLFARRWVLEMPRYPNFIVSENVCVTRVNPDMGPCPARTSFLEGLRRQHVQIETGVFAWHGTSSMAAVTGISHESFDVNRRSGQVFGRGEYFGVTAGVSHCYSRRTGQMLLCFLLKGSSFFTHVPGFCYVIDNPIGDEVRYCVPLLIVSYNNSAPPMLHDRPITTQGFKAPPGSLVEMPYRFMWLNDCGWSYYSTFISMQLEEAYEQYMNHGGSATCHLSGVVRFLDDIPQDYDVIFGQDVQINCKTRYQRAIRRSQVHVATTDHFWCYYDDAWHAFDDVANTHLESAYAAYCRPGGKGLTCVSVAGRPEMYEVNFARATQKNLTTGIVRSISRVPNGTNLVNKARGIDPKQSSDDDDGSNKKNKKKATHGGQNKTKKKK